MALLPKEGGEGEAPEGEPADGGPTLLSVVRSGIGLATDLYDLTIINAIRPQLEDCYGPLSDSMNGAITSATSAGAIVGQLTFGYAADAVGRRPAFIATASLLCVGAAGGAASFAVGGFSAYEVLLMWRLLLGIGIGGEYPLSCAVTAEGSSAEKSATSMVLTYMMFQVGQLLAPAVTLCCLYLDLSAQVTWRLCLAFGALLALAGAALRFETMRESEAWLTARAASKKSAVCSGAVLQAIWLPLLGTTSTYFLYDVVSWGVGSYTSSIFKSDTREGTLWYMLLINFMATPGFILTLWMGRFGRRAYQLWGFFGMAACMIAVGLSYGHAPMVVLVLIFGVQKIFDSGGPGATTFIIPGEIFPTSVRATCHGASSAAGKAGAFVGMYFFPVLESRAGYPTMLVLGGAIMLVGMAFTAALTPPYTAQTLARLRALADGDLSRTTEILWSQDADSDASDGSQDDSSSE